MVRRLRTAISRLFIDNNCVRLAEHGSGYKTEKSKKYLMWTRPPGTAKLRSMSNLISNGGSRD